MSLKELSPGRLPCPLRRWLDPVLFENIPNRVVCQIVAQVGQCSQYAPEKCSACQKQAGPVAQDVIRLMKLENSGTCKIRRPQPEFPSQNVYFSATCISRIFVRVEVMVPKLELVMALSGLPQFGWFGKLNASNRNWSA